MMKFNKKNQLILTVVGGAILYAVTHNNFSVNNGVITFKYPSKFSTIVKNILPTTNNTNTNNTNTSDDEIDSNSIHVEGDNNDGLVVNIDYGFFQLEYNCDKGGFNNFSYNTVPDPHIDFDRYGPFKYDKTIGELCNFDKERIDIVNNTNTYRSPNGAFHYDRGHGNHQNIWDHDKNYMKITNFMSNIVPQQKTQNRSGLWRHSEVLTQCLRGTVKNGQTLNGNDLYVVGGNIWGNDASNDHFIKSHGVVTPDYLFKIIVKNNKDVIAFVVPNNPDATRNNSSKYMKSINEIEELVGYEFDIDESLKDIITKEIPKKPYGCSIK